MFANFKLSLLIKLKKLIDEINENKIVRIKRQSIVPSNNLRKYIYNFKISNKRPTILKATADKGDKGFKGDKGK